MRRKLDSEIEIIRKEIRKQVKKGGDSTSGSKINLVSNYKYIPSGGSNFGGNTGSGGGNNYFEVINDPNYFMMMPCF